MAQLIFPANPVDGQTYAGDNGVTYTYKSPPGVWTAADGSGAGPVGTATSFAPNSYATFTGQYTPPGDIQYDGSRYYANGLVAYDWAGLSGYQISDDGRNWTWAPLQPGDLFIRQAVVAPDGNLLGFGGTLGSPPTFRPGNDFINGIYRSTDRGETWTLVSAEASSRLLTQTCISVDPDSGLIIAFSSWTGWKESSDNGLTWQVRTPANTISNSSTSISPTSGVVGSAGYWWTTAFSNTVNRAVRFPQATPTPTVSTLSGSIGARYVSGAAASRGLTTNFVAVTGQEYCQVYDAITGAAMGSFAGTASTYSVTCSWIPSLKKLVVSEYDPPGGAGVFEGPLAVSSDGVTFTDVQSLQQNLNLRPTTFSEVGGEVVSPVSGTNLLLGGWNL